jgi:hypothetical protein
MKKLAVVLAAALVLPATAAAKGPVSASITGPGLDEPAELTGLGEPGSVGTLGRVAEHGGLFAALGGSDWGILLDEQPTTDLGPRYTATFVMRDRKSLTVRQDLYPFAQPSPVTYTPPGQKPFGTLAMGGGWYVADAELEAALLEAGLPATAPSGGGDGFAPDPYVVAPAVVAAFALTAAAALLLRRRFVTAR